MSEIQNWNEDEEDFPIPIKEAGKTESRLSALLFNLLTRHSPMSFTKIRSLLPDHYQNLENPDSDRKKTFQRHRRIRRAWLFGSFYTRGIHS